MARKQSDYLADLLADTPEDAGTSPSPAPSVRERVRGGTTLLGRESAIARVASGEVRQVTQLLLDPSRVRVWPGNARSYEHLSEERCRDLIDSIIAEGGQKVPAIVRRVEGDPDHDYEVIVGTRRHWAIGWLRANSYPDMQFVAQVAVLDDEAAFRIADIENRARKDVSDFERARNYADALKTHYGNHLTRMAERLRVSKGWLSKMLKVASIPDSVVAAFASPADIQLKPGYALAQALDQHEKAIVQAAKAIARKQAALRDSNAPLLPAADVLKQLLDATRSAAGSKTELFSWTSGLGRVGLSVQTASRQGATIKVHAGSGAAIDELVDAFRNALMELERLGKATGL